VPVSSAFGSKHWLRTILLALVVVLIVASYSNPWLSKSGSAIPIQKRTELPDFAYQQAGGGTWRLSEHRGQVVLLNFWATWCPPCRQETPGLVRLQNQFRSKSFAVAGVDMDENRQAIPAFLRKFGVTYPILLPGPDSVLVSSVESLPTTLLIDKNGRVAQIYSGAVAESVFATDVKSLLIERARTGCLTHNR
jgi:cytochrome c biogenesis protein CcmG, thiol:disulfide interchange protein DsbE